MSRTDAVAVAPKTSDQQKKTVRKSLGDRLAALAEKLQQFIALILTLCIGVPVAALAILVATTFYIAILAIAIATAIAVLQAILTILVNYLYFFWTLAQDYHTVMR